MKNIAFSVRFAFVVALLSWSAIAGTSIRSLNGIINGPPPVKRIGSDRSERSLTVTNYVTITNLVSVTNAVFIKRK